MPALDQIDGDSLSGICFVGHSQFMYSSFIFAPVTLSFFVGLAFVAAGRKVPFYSDVLCVLTDRNLFAGIYTRRKTQFSGEATLSDQATAVLRNQDIRLCK